jgi:hypothetical protein
MSIASMRIATTIKRALPGPLKTQIKKLAYPNLEAAPASKNLPLNSGSMSSAAATCAALPALLGCQSSPTALDSN